MDAWIGRDPGALALEAWTEEELLLQPQAAEEETGTLLCGQLGLVTYCFLVLLALPSQPFIT